MHFDNFFTQETNNFCNIGILGVFLILLTLLFNSFRNFFKLKIFERLGCISTLATFVNCTLFHFVNAFNIFNNFLIH
jgi:hypothetical protein